VQYKTERNGVVETRVEQKITIQSDGDPIDHDRALAEAIQVPWKLLMDIIIITLLMSGHRPSLWIIHKETGHSPPRPVRIGGCSRLQMQTGLTA
jgi:hypothetical protein